MARLSAVFAHEFPISEHVTFHGALEFLAAGGGAELKLGVEGVEPEAYLGRIVAVDDITNLPVNKRASWD